MKSKLTICVVCVLLVWTLNLVVSAQNVTTAIQTIANVSYDEETKCMTDACAATGLDLLKRYMNIWAEPCDDFYEFACGTWARHHRSKLAALVDRDGRQPEHDVFFEVNELTRNKTARALLIPEAGHQTSQSKAIHYVTELFRQCVNTSDEQGEQRVMALVHSLIGHWPMVDRNQTKTTESLDWSEVYTRVYAHTGLGVGLQFTVLQPTLLDLIIDQSQTLKLQLQPGLNGAETLFKEVKDGEGEDKSYDRSAFSRRATQYKEYIRDSALVLGATDDRQLTDSVDQVFTLENRLALLTPDHSGSTRDFAFLTDDTDQRVDWLRIANSIVEEQRGQMVRFASYDAVQYDRVYLNAVVSVLDSTPASVVRNWFAWHLVNRFGVYGSAKLRRLNSRFYRLPDSDRQSDCLDLVTAHLPWAVGRVFIDRHFDPQMRQMTTEFVNEIKSAFGMILSASEWLDENTRTKVQNKLNAIVVNVGYPDWLKSDQTLDLLYSQWISDSADPVFQSGNSIEAIARLLAIAKVEQLKKLRDSSDAAKTAEMAAKWGLTVLDVNAVYRYRTHTITIPAALFQPPFFDLSRPFAMNYGSIGSVIGHELTHAFDLQGHDFEFSWDDQSIKRYRNRTECLEQEYQQYDSRRATVDASESESEPESESESDDESTLDDDIADNGGVHEALVTLTTRQRKHGRSPVLANVKQTAEQLFFLSYAQNWCSDQPDRLESVRTREHSPNRDRVNVVLANWPSFAQAFHCPIGSKMNPGHRCNVW